MAKLLSEQLRTQAVIHLHTDSGSVGDGCGKITDYFTRFKELGVEYATLTDHGDPSGLIPFYKAARKHGVNPGLGLEFYLNDDRDIEKAEREKKKAEKKAKKKKGAVEIVSSSESEEEEADNPDDFRNNHLIAVAKNAAGLKAIIQINNEAVENGYYYKPRTTTDKIFEYAGEGNLLISTACLAGFPARMILAKKNPAEIKKRLMRWKERFGDDFYIELQYNELEEQRIVNNHLIRFGKELKIKTIVAQDCHYVMAGDHFVQMLKMLIRSGGDRTLEKINDSIPKNLWIFDAKELFVKTNEAIIETAKREGYSENQTDIVQSLINNQEWGYKSKLHWDLSVKRYYKFQPPPGYKTSEEFLIRITDDALVEFDRKGWIPTRKPKPQIDDLYCQISSGQKTKKVIRATLGLSHDETMQLFDGQSIDFGGGTKISPILNEGPRRIIPIEDYRHRLNYERRVLVEKEYHDYILSVWKMMDRIRENVAARPSRPEDEVSEAHLNLGRGSGSACLVTFLLRIHKIDPIRYNLLFERFLSDARSNEMRNIDFE